MDRFDATKEQVDAAGMICAFLVDSPPAMRIQIVAGLLAKRDRTLAAQERAAGRAEGCPECGFVNGRPVENCGHVGSDGCCQHPENMTPECHTAACPMYPPAAARAKAGTEGA